MAIIKCKMCGGDIVLSADKTFGTCEYCGSSMTLPKIDDDRRAAAFNRGNHFRRIGEFDKALAVYERIVQENEQDAEAHWCCALCRFGIEYVEDPVSFEWLPTCHRASFDSFLEDVDYQAALEYSDGITHRQYIKDGMKISEVQKGILATSQSEEPYDVFLCYKENDDAGTRTRDSVLAQEIYYQLTEQGRRVFFSRITLEDKVGTQYEPYIFAALNSAKVMIVVGTKPEYLNSVWVKNEWSRFLAMMRKDRSKLLIPCYLGLAPYDLPEQLSVLQSYDMSKLGFMQDLLRGIGKILDAEKKTPVKETVILEHNAVNTAPLLRRAFLFLEDGDWTNADEYCEKVLDQDPENALAYVGKLMAQLHVRKQENLKDCREPFDDQNHYRKAIRFADETLKAELTGYNAHIRERNETARKAEVYNNAVKRMDSADTESAFQKAAEQFDSIPGFRDSEKLAKQCREKIEAIQAEKGRLAEEKVRIAAQKKQEQETQRKKNANVVKKRNKTIAILAVIAVVCAAAVLLAGKFLPKEETQNTQVAAETETISALETTVPLSPEEIAYQEAEQLLSNGETAKAAIAFGKLGDYKDARERSFDLWRKVLPNQTISAGCGGTSAVKTNGDVLVAGDNQERQLEAKGWKEIIGISEDHNRIAGLKYDGTVVAIGGNADAVSDWHNVVAIETSGNKTVALMSDGTVACTGRRADQMQDWENIVAISTGNFATVGLRADGTLVVAYEDGERAVPCDVSQWTDIIGVGEGNDFIVGLKRDGTLLVTGDFQTDVSHWTDIKAISAANSYIAGLKTDGTVIVAMKKDVRIDSMNPSEWTDIVAISAGYTHLVGLRQDGSLVSTGQQMFGVFDLTDKWTDIKLPQ